ncbi:hypothetical protein [Luteipulveratus mongoliensis]|uniref:Uncharacterized protein n=1 Tax=Luteipulveratus mongoliensis TaxID=571913 RepID=A0A0K1JHW7_9MICO|nr:hypothetical protein [Luteipulveratus mongoliensis]AKU16291.1 hypothetical protein VV02_11155 [Luteipulveratus mongoliensis]
MRHKTRAYVVLAATGVLSFGLVGQLQRSEASPSQTGTVTKHRVVPANHIGGFCGACAVGHPHKPPVHKYKKHK